MDFSLFLKMLRIGKTRVSSGSSFTDNIPQERLKVKTRELYVSFVDLQAQGKEDNQGKVTSELRVRLAPLNRFKPSSKIFY